MATQLLRHRNSGVGQKGSRRIMDSNFGEMAAATTTNGPPEVMFEVLFRGPDLLFRLFFTTLFFMCFAYAGATVLAVLCVLYTGSMLLSAWFYYRSQTFTSSVVLCTATIVLSLIGLAFSGGMNSCFVPVLLLWPSMALYSLGPKTGLSATGMLVPCIIALGCVPSEWDELGKCLSQMGPETSENITTVMRIIVILACTIVQCGIMAALMCNLKQSSDHSLKIRLEAQATEEANRFRRDFVASISHELRTPMNAICGACENLVQECQHPDDPGWISLIDNSARTLLALVNDIISVVATQQYGSPGRKRFQLQHTPCDFPMLLKDVLRLARQRPKLGVELLPLEVDESARLVCDPLLHILMADPDCFRQIVSHLVSNALKFTERGSVRVTLTSHPTSPEGNTSRVMVLVTVSDTGIGIAPDKLGEIFEPFTQLDGTATRRYGGTGIGLTLSRNFAEIMKGSIKVTSVLGQGSRFVFQFPVSVAKVPSSQADSGASLFYPPAPCTSPSPSSSLSPFFASPSPSPSPCLFSSSSNSTSFLASPSLPSFTTSSSPSSSAASFFSSSSLPSSSLSSFSFLGCSPFPDSPAPSSFFSTSSGHHRQSVSSGSRPGARVCGIDLTLCVDKDKQSGSPGSPNSDEDSSGTSQSPSAKRTRIEVGEQYKGCLCIVVDDNLVNLRLLTHHLNRLGVSVETAVDGEKAIAVAREHGARASCIFMDIMMPNMGGLEATRRIRQLGEEGLEFLQHIPIYACTTTDSPEEFLEAGMDGCILKPVLFATIQDLLRDLVSKTKQTYL